MTHVLVVEDEPAIAELVEDALSMHGFSVEVAHDGREGLRRILEHAPDVVLTDLMMPFVSGVELAAAIRDEPHSKAIPIVLMSAIDRPPGHARDLFDAFLPKPFDVKKLLAVIRSTNSSPPT